MRETVKNISAYTLPESSSNWKLFGNIGIAIELLESLEVIDNKSFSCRMFASEVFDTSTLAFKESYEIDFKKRRCHGSYLLVWEAVLAYRDGSSYFPKNSEGLLKTM